MGKRMCHSCGEVCQFACPTCEAEYSKEPPEMGTEDREKAIRKLFGWPREIRNSTMKTWIRKLTKRRISDREFDLLETKFQQEDSDPRFDRSWLSQWLAMAAAPKMPMAPTQSKGVYSFVSKARPDDITLTAIPALKPQDQSRPYPVGLRPDDTRGIPVPAASDAFATTQVVPAQQSVSLRPRR